MVALAAGENGDGEAHADGGGREPLPLAQVENITLGEVGVGEGQGERGQIGILLHADLTGHHLGLLGQLAEGGVALQRGPGPFLDIAEHLAGILVQGSGHVDVPVQVDAHHGLELPQGEFHGILRVVQVRDGSGDIGLRPGEVEFGSLRRVVAHLGEAEVLHRVLIHGVIDIVRLLGKQDGEEGLLDGSDRSEAGLPGLFHGQFHLVAGQPETLPELEVHQGHLGAESQGDGVGTAHFHRLGRGGSPFLAGTRIHVRDIRDTRTGVELLDVVHDGVHERSHHAGHTAGRGRTAVIVGLVGPEIDFLLLQGVTVHPGGAHLREQGCVGTLPGILLPLDLEIRDLHGSVLAEGDLQGVLQGEDHLPLFLPRSLALVLRQRRKGQQDPGGEDGKSF